MYKGCQVSFISIILLNILSVGNTITCFFECTNDPDKLVVRSYKIKHVVPPVNSFLLLEYKSSSCEYYRDQLAATEDGIYAIYLDEGEKKSRVHCVHLQNRNQTKSIPIDNKGNCFNLLAIAEYKRLMLTRIK